jgi:hypothetical protein
MKKFEVPDSVAVTAASTTCDVVMDKRDSGIAQELGRRRAAPMTGGVVENESAKTAGAMAKEVECRRRAGSSSSNANDVWRGPQTEEGGQRGENVRGEGGGQGHDSSNSKVKGEAKRRRTRQCTIAGEVSKRWLEEQYTRMCRMKMKNEKKVGRMKRPPAKAGWRRNLLA